MIRPKDGIHVNHENPGKGTHRREKEIKTSIGHFHVSQHDPNNFKRGLHSKWQWDGKRRSLITMYEIEYWDNPLV